MSPDEQARRGEVGEPYLDIAARLLRVTGEACRARPHRDVSAEMRGVPAVMRELVRAGGRLAPGEIASLTGVTDSRVANILHTMEARGWVTRTKGADDRRRVVVELTEAGRAEHERRADQFRRRCAELLSELGEDDARQMLHVMTRVAEVLAARAERGEA